MSFVAVRGSGDPNEENGAYQRAIAILYAISYTIKMSKKGTRRIDGYVDFVVPPLEGFWWQEGIEGADYAHKEGLPLDRRHPPAGLRAREVFDWAVQEATQKKKVDCSIAEFLVVDEGLCVQCLHVGSYDSEPATVEAMDAYAREAGYELDLSEARASSRGLPVGRPQGCPRQVEDDHPPPCEAPVGSRCSRVWRPSLTRRPPRRSGFPGGPVAGIGIVGLFTT